MECRSFAGNTQFGLVLLTDRTNPEIRCSNIARERHFYIVGIYTGLFVTHFVCRVIRVTPYKQGEQHEVKAKGIEFHDGRIGVQNVELVVDGFIAVWAEVVHVEPVTVTELLAQGLTLSGLQQGIIAFETLMRGS